MAAGLDQYLAQWLTKNHVMQVVADPKIAEVFMTDRLGEAFEQKMKQILPADEKKTEDTSRNTFRTTKARGTIFLVDAKSREVVWSIYDPPKDFAAKEMNHTASDIVSRLKRDLNPKK